MDTDEAAAFAALYPEPVRRLLTLGPPEDEDDADDAEDDDEEDEEDEEDEDDEDDDAESGGAVDEPDDEDDDDEEDVGFEVEASAPWLDYVEHFGLGDGDTDALLRMACDIALHDADTLSAAVWAPMHAWRALGQLRAAGCAARLIDLAAEIPGDVMLDNDLPAVLALMGPAVIPAVTAALADEARSEEARITLPTALTGLGLLHVDRRSECVATLARCVASSEDAPALKGFAVAALADLKAVEAFDAVRMAYSDGRVDMTVVGDLEDAEIAFGLREVRATPRPNYGDSGDFEDEGEAEDDVVLTPVRSEPKVGRNDPCPCGSGKKYKKCCLT